MSRIGKSPIEIPSGVEVKVAGRSVTVKGPKGQLVREIPAPITVETVENTIVFDRPDDLRESRSLHGLSRSLVQNMVIGVTQGFTKGLEIVGVGYRANAKGKDALELSLGFSHTVNVKAPAGIEFDVPTPTQITVIGIDKEVVGQVAANIRETRKPEPYKGKGVRYVGEHVRRKSGKTAK